MKDGDKTTGKLIKEVAQLRRRIAELEASGRKRNQFEEALRESEEKYRTILENIEDGYYEVDLAGNFTFFNDSMCRIQGYPRDELMGMNNRDYMDKETAKKVYKIFNAVLRTGKSATISDWQIIRKDKSRHDVEASVSLMRDASGNSTGFRGVIRDITERKQAENKIRESKQLLEKTFASLRDALLIIDANTQKIIDCNPASSEIFGYDRNEMVGQKVNFLHVDDKTLEAFRRHLYAAIEKQGFLSRLEFKMKRKDGMIFTTEHNVTPLDNDQGERIIWVSIVRDITERKQAEESLRQSAATLRALINAPTDSVLLLDARGVILDINEIAAGRLGKSRDELIGTLADHSLPEDVAKRRRSVISRIFETGKEVRFEDERNEIWFDTVAHPIADKDGVINKIAIIARDITERKAAEASLRESEERYRRLVDNSLLGIGISCSNKIVFANPALLRLFGYDDLEEFAEMPLINHVAPSSRELIASRMERVAQGKPVPGEFEFDILRKNGSTKTLLASSSRYTLDEKTYTQTTFQDITDRKQAAEKLQENEQRYRILFDEAPVGICLADTETGIIIDCNQTLAHLVRREKADLIGKPQKILHPPQGNEEIFSSTFKQHLTDKKGQILETQLITKTGDIRKVEIKANLLYIRGRKVLQGLFLDITDRKRAEELIKIRLRLLELAATRSLAEFLQKTLDEVCEFTKSPVGFYHFVDEDQKTLSLQAWSTRTVNEFCQAAGEGMHYSIDQAGVWVDCIRERRPVVHNDYAALPHRKGMPEGHAAIVRELVVPIMRDDRFVAILGIGNKPQDYTDQDVQAVSYLADIAWETAERKRAEEALRESEEKYRDLVENINDILYATDENGIITYIAPAIESLSGYTISEIIGHSFFEFVYEDDISSMKDNFQQDVSGQAEPHEYRMMTKAGDIRWVRTSSRSFCEGGRVAGLRGVFTDITERKQAEAAIKHGYEQLQETLHSTVKALATTVEMKDQYTAGHQPRVTQLACAIAEEMGLSEDQVEGIRMAASIHDIGKIMVPAEILNKPGRLTEIQYEMIKMHPRAGYDILKGLKLPWPVAQIILQHHERQDGSGYPQGLSGEEIMVEARILAVANVVEAMNAHRPYRPAYDIKEALAEISKNRGTFYDAAVVDTCLRLFTEKGFTLAPLSR
jgi:PAS domain S-box-containing protein